MRDTEHVMRMPDERVTQYNIHVRQARDTEHVRRMHDERCQGGLTDRSLYNKIAWQSIRSWRGQIRGNLLPRQLLKELPWLLAVPRSWVLKKNQRHAILNTTEAEWVESVSTTPPSLLLKFSFMEEKIERRTVWAVQVYTFVCISFTPEVRDLEHWDYVDKIEMWAWDIEQYK